MDAKFRLFTGPGHHGWQTLRIGVLCVTMLLVVATFPAKVARADSPPTITANIAWDDNPDEPKAQETKASVDDIERAFNNARRGEEQQRGLSANVLGNLDLPTQAAWDALNDSQKALFLI